MRGSGALSTVFTLILGVLLLPPPSVTQPNPLEPWNPGQGICLSIGQPLRKAPYDQCNCKFRCGSNEVISFGYCGPGCQCCKKSALQCTYGASCGLGGKCRTGRTCPSGERPIPGTCGQNCICCGPALGCVFDGASYIPGHTIHGACHSWRCDGNTGQYKFLGVDSECAKCKAYLDPHIVTYDQSWSSYSYQGCGNYSLSQTGSSYQPASAIYANFKSCGGRPTLSCVDSVTFKNEHHTVITIGFNGNQLTIEVNGMNYNLPSFSPSSVQIMNTVHPVMVWKSGWNCVSFEGSSAILVKFCGSSRANSVYLWAAPWVSAGLEGLCGTVNDNIDDDFTTRDGSITSSWQRDPPEEFPLSWLVSPTANGDCDSTNGRRKRETQNKCESDSSILNKFKNQCNTAVTNGYTDAQPGEAQAFIDDCVFDLCHVNDPDDWINAVKETVQVEAYIQENTQVTTKCSGGCFVNGRKGFCSKNCLEYLVPLTERRLPFIPIEGSTCQKGCTCCTSLQLDHDLFRK